MGRLPIFITYKGTQRTLRECAALTGIPYGTIYSRYTSGLPPEVILSREPPARTPDGRRLVRAPPTRFDSLESRVVVVLRKAGAVWLPVNGIRALLYQAYPDRPPTTSIGAALSRMRKRGFVEYHRRHRQYRAVEFGPRAAALGVAPSFVHALAPVSTAGVERRRTLLRGILVDPDAAPREQLLRFLQHHPFVPFLIVDLATRLGLYRSHLRTAAESLHELLLLQHDEVEFKLVCVTYIGPASPAVPGGEL